MKKFTIVSAIISTLLLSFTFIMAEVGGSCTGDASCDFEERCHNGVCIKKKEFDFGSSGKTGKPCQIDADCIGSGSCVDNGFGEKYCSGE